MELTLSLAIGLVTASGVWLLLRPRTYQVIIAVAVLTLLATPGWIAAAPRLGPRLPRWLGVGDSTDVPGPFTTADLAADAAAVLDVIGWHSAHVFGISLGGMVAQELALTSPERVRALVLGCTYAGGAGSTLDAPGPMRGCW